MGVIEEESSQIALSLKGDHASFESLIEKYQKMIHALCYRMSGSPEEAEDLAQDTFVQAYLNLEHFRGKSRFSSWLYRIAVNQCLNWRTKQQRQARLRQLWANEDHEKSKTGCDSERIQDALMKLEPKQRAAIVLTVYDDLSHAEAARILNCSETTVSWRVFRARRKLRTLLEKQ